MARHAEDQKSCSDGEPSADGQSKVHCTLRDGHNMQVFLPRGFWFLEVTVSPWDPKPMSGPGL
jgi:hypothetical protein